MMSMIKELIKGCPIGAAAEHINDLFTQNGMYNRETVKVMRRVLKPDSICVDIGAHQGSVLTDMVKIANQAKHFAFEPLPHLAKKLRAKFPNVEIFEKALSDQAGRAKFNYVVNSPAYSGLRKRVYNQAVEIKEIEVEVALLDNLIPKTVKVDFVKLDIEGGEYHALKGALSTIHRSQPIIVFEASIGSTGQYGVKPDDLYYLVTDTMGYHISTMGNWLAGLPSYDVNSFRENWNAGPEYYFIAYPMNLM